MRISTKSTSRRGASASAALVSLTILTAVGMTACKGILSVDLPTRVSAGVLNDPSFAPTMVQGAIADRIEAGHVVHMDRVVEVVELLLHVVPVVADLPADDGGIVERILKALASRFDTDAVTIDTAVFNPSRITKVYGTVAKKGDHGLFEFFGFGEDRLMVHGCLQGSRLGNTDDHG